MPGAADDFALMQPLDELERRLDHRELDAESARDLDAGQLAGKVQQLQDELDEQIQAQPVASRVVGLFGSSAVVRSLASRASSASTRHHG